MSDPDAGRLVSQLIRALSRAGVDARRLTTSSGLAGVALGTINGGHPGHTVLITTGGAGRRDIAWGSSFQHTLPLTTPIADVALTIVETLGHPFTDGTTPCRVCRVVHPQKGAMTRGVLGASPPSPPEEPITRPG